MKKLALLLVVFTAMLSFQVKAQRSSVISYSVGFGVGDLGDYIEKPSFRGISYEFNKYINSNTSVGVAVGLNVFYEEKSRATYEYDNVTVTGKQYRYSNHVPILFRTDYYLEKMGSLTPYGGLGIGTIYTRRDTDMGLYSVTQEAWNFALAPEIGILYEVNPDNSISLSVKYYNGFKSGNELEEAQSYFAINLGFAL